MDIYGVSVPLVSDRIVNIDRWMEIILLPRAQHPLTRLYWSSELSARPHHNRPVQARPTRLLDLIWCWPRWTIRYSNLLDTIHVPNDDARQTERIKQTFKCHSALDLVVMMMMIHLWTRQSINYPPLVTLMVVYTFIKNNSIPVVSIQINTSGGGAGAGVWRQKTPAR